MNRMTPKLQNAVRHQAVENRIAPSLERRRLRAYVLMLLADGLLFQLSFALAGLLWEGRLWHPRAMLAAQALLPVYFTGQSCRVDRSVSPTRRTTRVGWPT